MLFLYILLGLVVLILILAALAPKTYDVSRSVEIAKPKSEVFQQLKYLKKQDEWSPWARRDPNMEQKFTGTDGEVGAISYWNGNKEVGEGEQEITKIADGERVETQLRFLKPWKSTSDAYLISEALDDNHTKVIWGFSGKNKFPMSIMMLFMNMDKIIGKDFEEGLSNLKNILEK
ncbi:SRPBCC family protein [Flagellimonas sediminis]|uniref:Polyketide cyclase n=1 Tax=Flagellimonas sediminis TaxID=2696468 RepID=A0A6I5KU14_9FLAO|nr:SRPBCC family protein [Allomuricauda sediminis]NDV43993.1 polyketide cyclase [Allomuricauda sediminis]